MESEGVKPPLREQVSMARQSLSISGFVYARQASWQASTGLDVHFRVAYVDVGLERVLSAQQGY